MADKLNSGDVYTNHVGGNLVVVDPNKIVEPSGKVVDRLVSPEDLVMYANLSARIYPRSKIIAGAAAGDEIKIDLFDGELNFLKPGGKKHLDSDWTDAFTQPDLTKNPTSSSNEGVKPAKFFDNQKDFGGFGITSISVKVNASYIPQVSINFTDIRGKTLFEQARTNTPYTAFFHLPYPTFFLTLKGYYGKAVRYQLTLEKFVSRFDPGSGDYLVTCDFKGNHIALLRDINMHQCVTAPYMYPTRMEGESITGTKGRQVMHEVYAIYKKGNLIKKDFPEYTIVELIQKIQVLDNDLGKLYGQANLTITTNKLEYENDLIKIKDAFKDNWMAEVLSNEFSEDVEVTIIEVDSQGQEIPKKTWVNAYPLKNIGIINDVNKTPKANKAVELEKAEKEGRELLNQVLLPYIERLENNPGFGEEANDYRVKNLLGDFSYDNLKVNQPGGVTVENTDNLNPDLAPWFIVNIAPRTFYEVVTAQQTAFDIQAKIMEKTVAAELNTRLENYIGFLPTIRNVFAIIVAGADTFLRLLDDVHTKAMKNSTNPKRLAVANQSNDSTDICYPWPQYYVVEEEGDCGITASVLKYPGAKDVIDITKGENKNVWPEVEFVEEYTKSTTYRLSDYKFSIINTAISKQFIPINVRDWPSKNAPYLTKDNTEFLFELLDRTQAIITYGSVMTRYQSYVNKNLLGETLIELAGYEAENINFQIKENPELQDFIATISSFEDMEIKLKHSSPYSYSIYEKFGVVTPFTQKTFTIEPYPNNPYDVYSRNFTKNTSVLEISKQSGLFDIAPIICNANPSTSWISDNFAGGKLIGSTGDFYSIYKNLVYDTNHTGVLGDTYDTYYWTHAYDKIGVVLYDETIISTSPSGPQDTPQTVNEYYQYIIDERYIDFTEGRLLGSPTPVGGTPLPNQSIADDEIRLASMLNTPYFINALINGVTNDKAGSPNPYAQAAYLFLQSLPIITFREKVLKGSFFGYTETEFGEYVSVLFNQMPALHTVPMALLLKIGSIWWRYKTEVKTQTDPLTAIWASVSAPNIYDPVASSLNTSFTFSGVTDSATLYNYTSENVLANEVQVGVYPELIDAIHYIVTNNSGNYTPPIATAQLNNILNPLILPASDVNLSIATDTDVSFSTSENTKVKYYSVYLDSDNITDKSMGVKFGNRAPASRYFILYPSSGALTWTEAPSYSTSFMPGGVPNDIISLHNGAARLYWSSSPKGYFNHRITSQPAANRYLKVIDTSQDQQETPWQTIEQLGITQEVEYATIEELRGVFNTEQLDEFEDMFLNFSNSTNPGSTGGTLKKIIKQLMVVEDTYIDINDLNYDFNVNVLAIAQAQKFSETIKEFLYKEMDYAHNSTTNLDMIVNGSTVLQNLMALFTESVDYDFGTYAQTSSSSLIPTIPGGSLPVTNQEFQDMKIFVGEYYSQINPQFFPLTTTDITNPLYSFFTTIRPDTNGITFNSRNIQAFAPLIRMYGTYCVTNTAIPAHQYLQQVVDELESLNTNQEEYINSILKQVKGKIKKEKDLSTLKTPDDRQKVEADDLKLDLYNGFKTMNDRWISGINLTATGGTLFERFLFFDRANRDIGNEAVINIWDILKLDSPFDDASSKTLTQGISSYLSIILANNFFNFIPLPSYINFFNLENNGYGSSQLQGNAMFGTFKTVDYLDSKPAFLCQYVGKPSSQLDVKTHNNGYSTDTFNANKSANNPLIGEDCGDKNLSNKVMGFNVDFGLPNQNIFESVTLDQAQYQNTAESYRILQEMANSGGGGATSMASLSLYNVYASRSYSAKITCMGNVTIQPTQYFQLRYLPMFNGPYLIINVEHDIRPNTIETTFEGIRVPIPKLPQMSDIIQRVNESLYKEAETNLVESRALSFNFDSLTATASQMKLQPESSGYIDSGSTWLSTWAQQDAVDWRDPMDISFVDASEHDPQKPHLGIDFTPKTNQTERAISETGLFVYPALHGVVTTVKDNCLIGDNSDACAKGNYIEIINEITANPVEGETSYYKTIYAFLREGILVKAGNSNESIISRSSTGVGAKKLGKLGNSGQSKGQHLHFEIRRGVKVKGKVVEHILNPRNFLPMFVL